VEGRHDDAAGHGAEGWRPIALPDRVLAMRPRTLAIALPALAVLVAAVVVLLQGDVAADLAGAAGAPMRMARHMGAPASFLALYLEESGVPVPVSGDVFVVYLGHHFAGSLPRLVLVWLGLVLTVVLGSTNLYLISRWWGRRLAEGRLGLLLHLTPARLAAAERWFDRWGAPAIIFGRHIFGLRVPITVAAGVLRVPYRVFAVSVAVSTAVWAGIWLWLGVTFGRQLVHFLESHRWAYGLLLLGLVLAVAVSLLTRARGGHAGGRAGGHAAD
jgi:membrane-associated protein